MPRTRLLPALALAAATSAGPRPLAASDGIVVQVDPPPPGGRYQFVVTETVTDTPDDFPIQVGDTSTALFVFRGNCRLAIRSDDGFESRGSWARGRFSTIHVSRILDSPCADRAAGTDSDTISGTCDRFGIGTFQERRIKDSPGDEDHEAIREGLLSLIQR